MRLRTKGRSSSNRDISEIPWNEICLIKVAARCVEIMEYLSRGSTPLSEIQDAQEEFFGFSYANLSKKLKGYQKIAYKYPIKLYRRYGMISINYGRDKERAAAFVKDVRAEFDRRIKDLRDSIVRLLPDTEAVTIKQVYQRYKQAGFTLVDNMKQFFELANCLDPRSFGISLQGDNRYFSEIVFTEKNKEFYVRRVQDFDSYPIEISEFLSRVKPHEDLSMYELENILGLERLAKLIDAKGGEADENGLKYANKALYGRDISDEVMYDWRQFDFADSKRCPYRISRSGAVFKSDEYGYKYDVLTDYMDKVRAEYDKRLEITRERFLEFLKTGRLNLHELCVKYGRRFNEEPFTKQDLFLLASTKDEETFLRRIEGDDINKAKIIFYRDANSIVYLQRASGYMIDHVFEETRICERREVEEEAREREARKGDWVPKRFTLDYYSPENSDEGEYSFRREPYSSYPDDHYSSGERERVRSESNDAPDSDVTPSTATSSDEEERRAKDKKRRKRIRTPSVTSRSPSPSRTFHKKSARTHQKQEVKLSPVQSKVKSSKQKQKRLETKGKDGNYSNIMPPPDRSISRFESSTENRPQPAIATSSLRKSPKMSATSSSMDQEFETPVNGIEREELEPVASLSGQNKNSGDTFPMEEDDSGRFAREDEKDLNKGNGGSEALDVTASLMGRENNSLVGAKDSGYKSPQITNEIVQEAAPDRETPAYTVPALSSPKKMVVSHGPPSKKSKLDGMSREDEMSAESTTSIGSVTEIRAETSSDSSTHAVVTSSESLVAVERGNEENFRLIGDLVEMGLKEAADRGEDTTLLSFKILRALHEK